MNEAQSNHKLGVILQIREPKLQEIKLLAKKGTANKWQGLDSNLGLTPRPMPLPNIAASALLTN